VKAAIAIVSSTIMSVWIIGLIPLKELHIHGPWLAISYRALETIFSLLMMKLFCPDALSRLTFRIKRVAFPGIALLVILLWASNVFQIQWSKTSFYMIWVGVLFTLFIGIDEEIYSRGLVFGVLERYGTWVAILVSSLDFGLLHITNYYFGGQNLDVTIAQMIGAASFGFMAAGLMLYSGSIWPSIIFHGLSDLQMTQESAQVYAKSLTASPDWVGTGVEVALYGAIGLLLIMASSKGSKTNLVDWGSGSVSKRLLPIALYFGLVDSEESNEGATD
jgi:membrane protease YdiL (CAAX protease family)